MLLSFEVMTRFKIRKSLGVFIVSFANAEKLIRDVDKKIMSWDERSSFTIKGVKNLSYSDMETFILYAETYLRYGSVDSLMRPFGGVGEVLEKYGLLR